MNTDALRKRIDRMIAAIEQQQLDDIASEFEQQRAALVSEGLVRRFALIQDRKLPDDFEEQCRLIDQDIERRKTPGIRVAERQFEQKYADELSTARDELIRRLEAIHEAESEGSAA